MNRYEVRVVRQRTEEYICEVEADTEEDAEYQAERLAVHAEEWEWEIEWEATDIGGIALIEEGDDADD